jgi:hypothetical protein
MLVGLCGLKNSGKDTVGAYLVKNHGFERRAFADKLKESAAALFDIEPWQLDEWKNDPGFTVQIRQLRTTKTPKQSHMTIREMLQRYGTEAHRDIFGEDFWLDATLPVQGFYAGRAIVVTDCRFENELERITLLGGHTVYVDRPAPLEENPHRSESVLLADYTLVNDGTIEELYQRVEKMLEDLSVEI